MINEEEYEAMKKLVLKHNSRIKTLYRLTSLSEITVLAVLIISLYPFYVTFGFVYVVAIFIIFFTVSCAISYMIQKNNR